MKNILLKCLPITTLILTLFIYGCDESPSETAKVELPTPEMPYTIVGTAQKTFYDDSTEISAPSEGDSFYGQDANYESIEPSYTDNGDGTITDNITGLMWQQDPGEKMTLSEAKENASSFNLGSYTDWRLPTIKELYSLIIFSGKDPSGNKEDGDGLVPFIDTEYFEFSYGDESAGERIIDAQYVSSTEDLSGTTFGGGSLVFGVNFADGRIKGYPSTDKDFFVLYVRGNTDYGKNNFVDNGDGTISDTTTGLMWQQEDVGGDQNGIDWKTALSMAEASVTAGYSDWRLPTAKELQSLVDYTKGGSVGTSPVIHSLFESTQIMNEKDETDYPYYWTSTTHASQNGRATMGAYVPFGRAMGYFNNEYLDVHGPGAQRSDPKSGLREDYPEPFGPQGDIRRVYNYARFVRSK